MRAQLIPATGPWVALYPSTACGAMLCTTERDVAASAACLGQGVVVGWRFRRRTFRDRRYVLGSER